MLVCVSCQNFRISLRLPPLAEAARCVFEGLPLPSCCLSSRISIFPLNLYLHLRRRQNGRNYVVLALAHLSFWRNPRFFFYNFLGSFPKPLSACHHFSQYFYPSLLLHLLEHFLLIVTPPKLSHRPPSFAKHFSFQYTLFKHFFHHLRIINLARFTAFQPLHFLLHTHLPSSKARLLLQYRIFLLLDVLKGFPQLVTSRGFPAPQPRPHHLPFRPSSKVLCLKHPIPSLSHPILGDLPKAAAPLFDHCLLTPSTLLVMMKQLAALHSICRVGEQLLCCLVVYKHLRNLYLQIKSVSVKKT